jgi:hypothetical protein
MPRSNAARTTAALIALLLASAPLAAGGPEPVDLEMVTRIRDEGFHRSQVMATAAHLTDVVGPRLTGSAGQRAANEWTRDRLAEWGLRSWIEEFEFGEGWTFRRAEVRMTAPVEGLLAALPEAWTPGTGGPVTGTAVRAKLESDEDLEKQKGELAGKIVFLDDPRPPGQALEGREATGGEADFRRWDDDGLTGLGVYEIPEGERGGGWIERARKRWAFSEKLHQFLLDEKVVALVGLSSRDHGIVRLGAGGSRGVAGRSRGIPSVVMASEPYHRVLRLLDEGMEVELAIDVEAAFDDAGAAAHNTLAEIPGGGLAGEVVLAGAHLDSWHAGTGATDNAGSCAVVMEAVRILKALGVKPRRTIRVALWTGEEQGLLGSRAYVEKHLADRPETTDPEELKLPRGLRERTWPIQPKPDHARFSAYFNLDNGGGKIRGIYAQENAAVRPIFEAWLAPFADLGATTVTLRNTGGTDHLPFDRVGLPGFQFIQDGLDYWSRTHHTHLDTFEHLHEADLKQASVVLASFLYHASMRDQPIPRKPMPQRPPEEPKRKSEGRDEASPASE